MKRTRRNATLTTGLILSLLLILFSTGKADILVQLGWVAPSSGDYQYAYIASLANDQTIRAYSSSNPDNPIDYVTIYDFGGFIPGTNFQPADWSFSYQWVGLTPPGQNPLDDPNIYNLTWTYVGSSSIGPGPTDLGIFGADSTNSNAANGTFASYAYKYDPGQPDNGKPVANTGMVGVPGAQIWQPLNNQPPMTKGASSMLLLTDGTVICHDTNYYQGGLTGNWYKLTPDNTGSYVNGKWSKIASMPSQYGPLYFASAVLADGRVVVLGGEDNVDGTSETSKAAIYDPIKDKWTSIQGPTGWNNIGDAQCCILSDGRFLLAHTVPNSGNPLSSNIAVIDFSQASPQWQDLGTVNKADPNSEEGWTLLPDTSILTIDCENGLNAERFVPLGTSGQWTNAGNTGVQLPAQKPYTTQVPEIGPAILLPDGTVFATGATSHTAIYDPASGTWTAGPNFPYGDAIADGPACLLPNGNVLCLASPPFSATSGARFYEYVTYDYLPQVASTQTASSIFSFMGCLLLLPTGQVLCTDGYANDVEIYTPGGAPDPSWAPTISSCPSSLDSCQSYLISGTQFNGLSQAVGYGDDYQAATNYPLVRIMNNASGHILYCRTHDHSFMGVASPNTVSTHFTVLPDIEPGPSSLYVVANGIQSQPYAVTVFSHISSLSPSSTPAGGPSFNLLVMGGGFTNASTVNWTENKNTTPLSTTPVSASQLKVTVPASLIANPGKASVTVTTPGAGASNSKIFTIDLTTLQLLSPQLSRNLFTGVITATISLKNTGYLSANNLTITNSSIGFTGTTSTLPMNLGNLAAGSTATASLTYPGSAGSSGAKRTLYVRGTFDGGSFSLSTPVILP